MTTKHRSSILFLIPPALALACASSLACDVPVFRYALERWPNDNHVLRLSQPAGAPRPAWADSVGHANLGIDTTSTNAPGTFNIVFPDNRPAWLTGSLTGAETVLKLADSPLRRRIAHEILTGASAVWVLVEGAQPASNALVQANAESASRKVAQEIKLPETPAYDPTNPDSPPPKIQANIPLQLRFPLFNLAWKDANESVLCAQLRALAPEEAPDKPLLAAIFGRGRAIVLGGSNLEPASIEGLAAFLCSACSCQTKELNPGTDLLITANWAEALAAYPSGAVTRLPGGGVFLLGGTGAPPSLVVAPATSTAPKAAPSAQPVLTASATRTPWLVPTVLGLLAAIVVAGLLWLFGGKR